MGEVEAREKIIEEVKNKYLNQLQNEFVENPYNWQVKMTLINMVIINLSAGKRRELFRYDDFCKETLKLSKESFEESGIEAIVPAEEVFLDITIKNSGDLQKIEEDIKKFSSNKIEVMLQRLEKIIMRKFLKNKFGDDFSESHVKFVDKFYSEHQNYKEMYSFVKEKFHTDV